MFIREGVQVATIGIYRESGVQLRIHRRVRKVVMRQEGIYGRRSEENSGRNRREHKRYNVSRLTGEEGP